MNNLPAAHEAAFNRMQAAPDKPECECGWTLGTYWDDDDHGGKVLMVAEQACPGCAKYHAERKA